MKNLAAAVVKAQQAFPPIPKDGLNPHFKSKFASLHGVMANVLPVLNEHGLALMQHPTTLDGQPALRTVLVHAESGELIEDTMLLVLAKNDPQGQGSALTYARRYAVLSTLGLVADEDDDGQAASRRNGSLSEPESGEAQGGAAASRSHQGPLDGTAPAPGSDSDPVVPFGKHKGKRVSQIPGTYLQWLAENFEPKNERDHAVLEAVKDSLIPF